MISPDIDACNPAQSLVNTVVCTIGSQWTTLVACAQGWHVPSDGEWTTMTDFLGGESVAGNR